MKTKTFLVLSVLFAGWVTVAHPITPCETSTDGSLGEPTDCPIFDE